ncbi:acyltransferase family protein [Azotobacter chroococcum]|uniref:Peptidoglycan/LPS O-acetylase OafA/YrhL n=1 Tax=Azotobacter chroococcum TaxID=353 RepID=A0A4R1PNB7_9GAMM|nr:acyltransferase family protein [Azotobacter chroococcum]TCL31854.1 peptidoglycan/LPS O-acetylase OafA/YrhL [Azotobacter chroococcum]
MSHSISASTTGANEFRRDINGLRAWAVMAVVLYHFGIAGFGGGFVGVDVFFVISGFLMSGIIAKGLQRGDFSLWDFYLARARRILPALIVLAAVLLAVGWFFLMPKEYETLGGHARRTLLFASNLRYLQESGYFDDDAHEKWLLHSWSLSVEWQFYLLLPVLLLAVWRLFPGRRAMVLLQVPLLLASFGVCVALTLSEPPKAFYLLQSRAWEFLAGGLLFLFGENLRFSARTRLGLEWLGLLAIVSAVVFLDSSSLWPGWLALVPCIGALSVLLAQRGDSPWTGNAVAQWLGTRSYSIYLWHWPLVAGLAYCERLESPAWVLSALFATLLLGQLSYALIEVPARRGLHGLTPRWAAAALLLAVFPPALAAAWIRETDGFPQRLPAAVGEIEAQADNRNPRQDECLDKGAACTFGGPSIRALMVGDSHADALVTAAQAALPGSQQGIQFRAAPLCLLVFGAHDVEKKNAAPCLALKRELEAELAGVSSSLPVIVINRTSVYAMGYNEKFEDKETGRPLVFFSSPADRASPEYLEEFRRHYVASACEIARHRPLFLMRPIPEMVIDVPHAMAKTMLIGAQREVSITLADYHKRHAFVWSLQDEAREQCGARILDPLPYLCDGKVCHGSRNGIPLYADDDHLSEFGNRLLVPMFAKAFASMQDAGEALAHRREDATR